VRLPPSALTLTDQSTHCVTGTGVTALSTTTEVPDLSLRPKGRVVPKRYEQLATAVVETDRELAIDLLAVIDGLPSVQTNNPMIIRLRTFREALDSARTCGSQATRTPTV
jgi:hypothetical protein